MLAPVKNHDVRAACSSSSFHASRYGKVEVVVAGQEE